LQLTARACFSNSLFLFSLNADRAPQLKASVIRLRWFTKAKNIEAINLWTLGFLRRRPHPQPGSYGVLPAGEIFTIDNNPPPNATAVYCFPDNYEALHSHFVVDSERTDPKYRGYYLTVRLADIADKCERVLGGADV